MIATKRVAVLLSDTPAGVIKYKYNPNMDIYSTLTEKNINKPESR